MIVISGMVTQRMIRIRCISSLFFLSVRSSSWRRLSSKTCSKDSTTRYEIKNSNQPVSYWYEIKAREKLQRSSKVFGHLSFLLWLSFGNKRLAWILHSKSIRWSNNLCVVNKEIYRISKAWLLSQPVFLVSLYYQKLCEIIGFPPHASSFLLILLLRTRASYTNHWDIYFFGETLEMIFICKLSLNHLTDISWISKMSIYLNRIFQKLYFDLSRRALLNQTQLLHRPRTKGHYICKVYSIREALRWLLNYIIMQIQQNGRLI